VGWFLCRGVCLLSPPGGRCSGPEGHSGVGTIYLGLYFVPLVYQLGVQLQWTSTVLKQLQAKLVEKSLTVKPCQSTVRLFQSDDQATKNDADDPTNASLCICVQLATVLRYEIVYTVCQKENMTGNTMRLKVSTGLAFGIRAGTRAVHLQTRSVIAPDSAVDITL